MSADSSSSSSSAASASAAETLVPGLLPGDLERIVALVGRRPNDTELRVFGVMWSEHCAYRHSRPLLSRFPTEGPAVVQGPGENAGVLDLGGGLGLAMKVESHNHPSAVDPYQGSATGVGGILRDVLALGARPVAMLDGLGFGSLDDPKAAWLARDMTAGIGGYGNAVGVPTVGGVTRVHPGYGPNPLLNAMCVGLLEIDAMVLGRAGGAGDLLLLLGATTGRDGVGGASFASDDLAEERADQRPQVQVGDPFAEKRLIEATLEAMAAGRVRGAQDMGAAGIVSSTTELCYRAGLGCELDLERVPLRQADMAAWEILLSESQERMLLAIAPEDLQAVAAIARHWSLEAAVIGRVVPEPVYRVRMAGEVVVDLPLSPLCDPPSAPIAPGPRPRAPEVVVPPLEASQAQSVLAALWASPDVRSRRFVYETYDSMVGARTVLGPPSGAAVLALPGRADGVAVSLDMNPHQGAADPYVGAALTVVEGVQNLAAVAALPLGLTDCLNLGDPTTPLGAAELEATVAGAAEACRALGVPVVGGNVSLYNESGPSRMPATFAAGVAGRVAAIEDAPGLGLEVEGERLVLVGPVRGDLACSAYARLRLGSAETGAPKAPDYDAVRRACDLVRTARADGLSRYAADVWTGGLGVAVLRGLQAAGLGARLDMGIWSGDLAACLFGEGAGRFVLAVSPERTPELLARADALGLAARVVGEVTGAPRLVVRADGRTVIDMALDAGEGDGR